MRFLLINQFYPPDVAPTGKYLHDLAQLLIQRGHQVKVFCSQRSYDGGNFFLSHEIMDGVEVTRLFATGFGRQGFVGKIADYASFYISLFIALMFERNRPDLILSLTTPPYAGLLGKLSAKRHNALHAHWVMDLYPDVILANGKFKDGMFIGWLRKLTRYQLKGASHIFTLGTVMAESVSVYGGAGNPVVQVIPLWSDSDLSPWPREQPNPLRIERAWIGNEVVLLYSGNMGLGHRFVEFLEAAKRLGVSGPRWVFAGGGKRKAEIEAFARLNPESHIDFLEYVPHDRLRAHLAAADVHLASLDSGWQGCMVPSKLQGGFAVGRPVIYVGSSHCETAIWIKKSGGGWVVEENDVEGLLAAIRQSFDPIERQTRGQAALNFARQHFQKSINCVRMAELLESVG
jgi:glycosyltransferase involved in cell wall biosynthesis